MSNFNCQFETNKLILQYHFKIKKKMPKGAGLTKPMKLSDDLADIGKNIFLFKTSLLMCNHLHIIKIYLIKTLVTAPHERVVA